MFSKMKSLEIEVNDMINRLEDERLRDCYKEKMNVMVQRIDSSLDFFMKNDLDENREWYNAVLDELLDSCNSIKFIKNAIKVDLEMQEILK